MARKKRESVDLDKLKKRLDGLKAVDPNLDLGNGISVAALTAAQLQLSGKLDGYNQALAVADGLLNEVETLEESARDLAERALSGVGSKYGRDSIEYEKAGGKRKSERKKPVRKPKG